MALYIFITIRLLRSIQLYLIRLTFHKPTESFLLEVGKLACSVNSQLSINRCHKTLVAAHKKGGQPGDSFTCARAELHGRKKKKVGSRKAACVGEATNRSRTISEILLILYAFPAVAVGLIDFSRGNRE